MTKVTIDRELLERIDESAICDGTDATISDVLFTQLVAALAAPRQPEGDDGLEVVGWHHSHAEVATSDKARVVTWLPECVEPLCRLSDAQRTIAELREECERLSHMLNNVTNNCIKLADERDTLRQQLAEQDATIARLEAGIPRIQEQSHQMRQQRDRLAELLADVKSNYTHAIHWEDMHATMKRIDAALAEVKPCPESQSPAPTT